MSVVNGNGIVRVGVLGYSDIARRKFIPALLQSRMARLTAIARRMWDSTEPLPVWGVPYAALTYSELLDSPDVDLIYISLPNHLHEQLSIAALQAGKHVLCEKPLGLDSAAVDRMLAAAATNGRLLSENLMYLHHPQHHAVKSLITAGGIGRLLSLHTEFAIPGPKTGDIRLRPALGGGAFNDMNRYPLSAALYFLTGKRHRLVSRCMHEQQGLNLSFLAETMTDYGERFTFVTSFGATYRCFYELRGERGVIRVERAYTTPSDMSNTIHVSVDGRDHSFNSAAHDHFLATIDHVCGLLQRGEWAAEHRRARQVAALADLLNTTSTEELLS